MNIVRTNMHLLEFEFRWGTRLVCFESEGQYKEWLYAIFRDNPGLIDRTLPRPQEPGLPQDHDFGNLNKPWNLTAKLDSVNQWLRYDVDLKTYEDKKSYFDRLMDQASKGNWRLTADIAEFLPVVTKERGLMSHENLAISLVRET